MSSGEMHDFVVRGGTLIDGTGREAYTADVAAKDGVITHVGPDAGPATVEYDADGLAVIPGFVDVHTHFDGQATWENRLVPSSEHGVTTVIAGNCGVGFAPAKPTDHQRLIDFMEGVEDIPGTALHEGISWDWEDFGEFLETLEGVPHDMDMGVYVPHCPVRMYVMGDRARADVAATPTEIEQMSEIVRQAVLDGAIGFSTSRTVAHRTLAGEHIPTLSAATEELAAIASAMGTTGRGIVQMITDFDDPQADFQMMRTIATQSGRPLSFSLVQDPGKPDVYREILELLSEATSEGLPMTAQVAPRCVGLIMGLDTTLNPFSRNPVYLEIEHLPIEERLAIMRSAEFRERLLKAHQELHESGRTTGRMIYSYERIFELGDPPDYEPGPSNSIAARSNREGREPADLMLEILTSGDGGNLLALFLTNTVAGDLEVNHEMLAHPDTIVGLSDGGAHVGMIADGSFPTTLLSHWGRDRQGDRFKLERLVHMQTARTAQLVGLDDRGVLAAGKRADINIIDMDRLRPRRPRIVHDLPAGGRRFLQGADGVKHTFVAGQETYRDGEHTGALPGRLVRGRPF